MSMKEIDKQTQYKWTAMCTQIHANKYIEHEINNK